MPKVVSRGAWTGPRPCSPLREPWAALSSHQPGVPAAVPTLITSLVHVPPAGAAPHPSCLAHPPCGFGCGLPGPPGVWCGSAGPEPRPAPASLSSPGPCPAGSSVSGASGPAGQLWLSRLELWAQAVCEGPGLTLHGPVCLRGSSLSARQRVPCGAGREGAGKDLTEGGQPQGPANPGEGIPRADVPNPQPPLPIIAPQQRPKKESTPSIPTSLPPTPWPALGTLLARPKGLCSTGLQAALNCGEFLLQGLQLRGHPGGRRKSEKDVPPPAPSPQPTQIPVQAKAGNVSTPQGLCGPTACPLPLDTPRQTHLEALVTTSGSGAGMQKQVAGARLVSPPGPCTTQVCGSVLSTSVYRSPRSSCT